jgi:clan AA aspartic protease (TIGR02281 family)
MSRLFTVRWPWFACVEAALLCPVAFLLVTEIPAIRAVLDAGVLPPIPGLEQVSGRGVFQAALAIVTAVLYLAALVVADRLLSVRKGVAVLSGLMVLIWTCAAALLAHRLAVAPETRMAALVVGGIAFLVHLRPLWIGLGDRGFAGSRVPPGQGSAIDPRALSGQAGRFSWVDGLGWGIICIAAIAGFTFRHEIAGGLAGTPAPLAAAPASGLGMEPPPMVTSSRDVSPAPTPDEPAEAPLAPRPFAAMQRPVMITPDMRSDDNEAAATRGRNGHFVFDAEVDGFTIPMMFDTGASFVTLRAEDAARAGIDGGSLNYSVRVRTANGITDAAPISIDLLRIGGITRRNVAALVTRRGRLAVSLLGQSFLTRVAGYHVDGDSIVLRGN